MDEKQIKNLLSKIDNLKGGISTQEYINIISGILFLKYISIKYDKKIKNLKKENPNKWKKWILDKDIVGIETFILTKKTNWNYISKFASSNEIGKKIDEVFSSLKMSYKKLKKIFNESYNHEEINQNNLGKIISEFSNIDYSNEGEKIISNIYEYFLEKFFFFIEKPKEDEKYYTPKSISKLLINIVNPKEGLIYDPACGIGELFIQCKKYIIKNKGDFSKLTIYGQEYLNKNWKLAYINLLINGFNISDIHLGNKSANSIINDQYKDKNNFDYIITNPQFNQKKIDLNKIENDSRWSFGLPPNNNANYAWLSHIVSKLSSKGKAAILMPNGSLSGVGKKELAIRKEMIKQNKLDAIITLPDKLFYATGIPTSIWIFNNHKKINKILMLDGSQLKGKMISKKLRELTKQDILKFDQEYSKHLEGKEVEKIGFAKTIGKKELEENDYSFVPGIYVGLEEEKIDKEEIKKGIKKSAKELKELFKEIEELTPKIEEAIDKAIKFENKN